MLGAVAVACVGAALMLAGTAAVTAQPAQAALAPQSAGGPSASAADTAPYLPAVSQARPRLREVAADVPPTGIDKQCHPAVRITNLTPYPWKLTALLAYNVTFPDNSLWLARPPETLNPGQSAVVQLNAASRRTTIVGSIICDFDGAYFTYEADTLNHPEFLSLKMGGHACFGICINETPKYSNTVLNTTASANPYQPPTPLTPNPEIAWTATDYHNVGQGASTPFDFTFQTKGNYTIDASSSGGAARVADLINAMCAGADGTTCTFTPTGPLTWGIGPLTFQGSADSVDCSEPPSKEPPPPQGTTPPPDSDPDWHEVSVAESRETSLSAGGSLSVGVEADLFDVIEAGVSAKFGVEREWSDNTTIDKRVRIYLPPNYIGGVWTAPVVAKVTGTLVVTTKLATYTITNFAATKDGVSPDLKTPPFDVMTSTRPLTDAEYDKEREKKCPSSFGIGPPNRPSPKFTG